MSGIINTNSHYIHMLNDNTKKVGKVEVVQTRPTNQVATVSKTLLDSSPRGNALDE